MYLNYLDCDVNVTIMWIQFKKKEKSFICSTMFYGCLWALWYWSVEYISKTSWFSLLRIVGFLSSEDTNKRPVFKSDLYVLLVELNFYDVKWTFLKKQITDQCLIVILYVLFVEMNCYDIVKCTFKISH